MISADRIAPTTCPYCGVGCKLELHIKDDYIYKAFGAPFDEILVVEPLLDNHVGHGRIERHIGAGLFRQPERRPVNHFHSSGIDNDQLGAVLGDRRFHLQSNDRMGFRGVGTGDKKHIAVNHFGSGVAHRRRTERHLQRND